jgi:CDP-paratose 2-epimerase
MRVLVTGGAGLVGSESCKLFAEKGWKVISVDNYMRGKLFGSEGNTKTNVELLLKDFDIEHYELDIRDERIIPLIKQVDVVIHTAAQPSHPKSIDIPMKIFK